MTEPLRIALVMVGSRDWMGGVEYIKNIILSLASLPESSQKKFEISLMISKLHDSDLVAFMRPYVKAVHIVDQLVQPTLLNRLKWGIRRYIFRLPDTRFNPVVKKNGFDFVYPYANGFDATKTAAWIPDFQHTHLKHFFSDNEIKFRDKMYGMMARKAPLVILSSRSAEADFKKIYPENASKARILSFKTCLQSAWFTAEPRDVQARYCLPDRFFLISNQFWQHKNHLIVFSAMKLLQQRNIRPVVVCTGRLNDSRQPHYADVILKTIHESGLAHQVYLLGLIPKIEQLQLLRRSLAVIQPSLFEGWNTVVEEARAFGKDVILSDIPVHQEQNPPMGRYFTSTAPESLADIMEDCWQSLNPGPDHACEEAAKKTNKTEIMTFANSFLEIAGSRKGFPETD